MRRAPRIGAFVASLLLLFACGQNDADSPPSASGGGGAGGAGNTGGIGGIGGQVDSRFDALSDVVEAELAATGVLGTAVAIIEDGEVVFLRGYGVRDPYSEAPVDEDTTFCIASMSKSLAATTLLSLLEEQSDVSVDTALVEVVPDFTFPPTEYVPDVTLKTLLTHMSGIPTYWDSHASAPERKDESAQALIDVILPGMAAYAGVGFEMRPGLAWFYSNPGFGLVGLAAESIGGGYFADLMKERVATPLGMTRTFARSIETKEAGNFTFGQPDPGSTKVVIPESTDLAWGRPAGAVWSSARDLARFVQFQLDGDPAVLSDEARLGMQRSVVSTQECFEEDGYGYGLFHNDGFWFIDGKYYDVETVWHTGGVDGFRSMMLWLPAERFGYVVLSNSSMRPRKIAEFIHENIAPLPSPSEPPPTAGDPEEWAAFEGTYFDPVVYGTLHLSVTDGTVHVDIPDAPAAYGGTLAPQCGNTFAFDTGTWGTLPMTLLRGQRGEPNHLRLQYVLAFDRVDSPHGVDAALDPAPERLRRADEMFRQVEPLRLRGQPAWGQTRAEDVAK